MTKHSELPWVVKDNGGEGDLVGVTSPDSDWFVAEEILTTNAALIVKAVNSHYQLLAALETAGDELAFIVNHVDVDSAYDRIKQITEETRAAIKQVEES